MKSGFVGHPGFSVSHLHQLNKDGIISEFVRNSNKKHLPGVSTGGVMEVTGLLRSILGGGDF